MILSLKMLFIYVAFSIVNIKHEGTYLECVLKSKFTFLIVNIKPTYKAQKDKLKGNLHSS